MGGVRGVYVMNGVLDNILTSEYPLGIALTTIEEDDDDEEENDE